jgi:hypothetical protein
VAAVSEKLRILVTGFGPFPGAPYNPTQALVARLMRLRRPAFADVELSSHIFPVTYKAVDRELPLALAKHKPHAILTFGLAGRTKYLRPAPATPSPCCGPTPRRPAPEKDRSPAVPMRRGSARIPQNCCVPPRLPASMPAPRAMPEVISATI